MQGFASSTPPLVAEATKKFAGKSLADAREAALGASETLKDFWQQAKVSTENVTVFGEGLGPDDNEQRYAKVEAEAQGAFARIKAIKEGETAEERNQLRIDAINADRGGESKVDSGKLKQALTELGIVPTDRPQPWQAVAKKFREAVYGGLSPIKPGEYSENAVLHRLMTGKLTVTGVGDSIFRQAAGDASYSPGTTATGGTNIWSPRDQSRVVELLRGTQYPNVLDQLTVIPWGFERYSYLEEDSIAPSDDGTAAQPLEQYPQEDGHTTPQEYQFHETEKSVTVRDMVAYSRLTEHLLRYAPEFEQRVMMRIMRNLQRHIEFALLHGDGTEMNTSAGRIQGLLENAGTTVQPAAASLVSGTRDYGIDYITRSRAEILKDAGAAMTFIVMHVDDWKELITARTNQDILVMNETMMPAGATLVVTDTITAKTVLVGDGTETVVPFGPDMMMDATKTARSQDFEKQIVTVRGTAYFNQAVLRPKAFHTITSWEAKNEKA